MHVGILMSLCGFNILFLKTWYFRTSDVKYVENIGASRGLSATADLLVFCGRRLNDTKQIFLLKITFDSVTSEGRRKCAIIGEVLARPEGPERG